MQQCRFSPVHLHTEDNCFFDNLNQSFVFPDDQWARYFLSSLSQGVSPEEIAADVTSYSHGSYNEVLRDLEQLLADLDVVDRSNENALDNRHLFQAADNQHHYPCRVAGTRRISGQDVVVGFSSQVTAQIYQQITHGSLMNIRAQTQCDVQLLQSGDRASLHASGSCVGDDIDVYEACLYAHNTTEDIVAKRMDTLFIAHAGAVEIGSNGNAALFPAQGHSGKSTLVAGLSEYGYRLINDDIVPVLSSGELVSLGSSIKLRKGSWSLFDKHFGGIGGAKEITSGSEQVKLIDLRVSSNLYHHSDSERRFKCSVLIVPKYDPDSQPTITPLTQEDGLKALVESESMFVKPLATNALKSITQWINTIPCYSVTYPDMQSGIDLVTSVAT